MVGQWPLKPLIGVRIPVPQPTHAKSSVKGAYGSRATETPQFGILKALKRPLQGLARLGSRLRCSASKFIN